MTALVLALVAGAVVGLSLGALGGGGSVLAVPALVYLLGFAPAAAATASLVIVTVTSATALAAHLRADTVRLRAGLLFAAAGLLPAALGGALSAGLPSPLLTAAFALTAGLAAYRMLRPSGTRREASTVRPSRVALSGAGLGGVTGVLGVGGGFLAVPALMNVVGLRMRDAVGTGLLVITVNSFAALAGRAGTAETLDWAVVAPFVAAAVLGAWDGRRLAAKVSGDTLRRIFAWLLLAVATAMLIDAIASTG
ncbi:MULTISPECIES: sulfite exporter TauE/SafE family protein [Streptomyces]|uniref:Probable membrane transporter protein n=1 Tax=Streptomyces caniscabiei TaxID=2746961 RepID=A0ABU4MXV3_9ACTN|nr:MULTISPECIES: sulfite exporter TauE/SafE family protein [Streptomyces]MBE4733838.1 sulfite exporter TauE/SafE family protein [Streptomyces caniscabiei]MBE4755015.1 sulfite exporter TauE/SafE family protein [Streptomyces caniscabiei]MBE4768165.1 sulfite exporter TauE/SafE family protein [Streptomyces caniscabiei]MBE4782333.1 sulfite exporter TauE/SafE family protein [Streptomyces caniscabiei]MBE4793621.1 sulfite exporter TauE/SafE family protein [Streptomyces caniscabiei]